jgi:site-specific DNA-methyltransferase (adenine-specific)
VTKKFNTKEGNIWFEPLEHTWVGGKTKLLTMDDQGNEIEKPVNSKCKFCGASKQDLDREEGLEQHAYGLIHNEDPKSWVRGIFGEEMKFDVIVGNPPYQLDDGGFAASAVPIYDKFVEGAMALEPTALVMVVPARWYSGGKGLDSFRSRMIESTCIKALVDYPDSSKVFPGVEIKGGVCYFLWSKSYSGEAEITTNMPDGQKLTDRRTLRTGGLDVFIRFPAGVSVLEKVSNRHSGGDSSLGFFDTENHLFRKRVSSSKPFGLRTNFRGESNPQQGSLKLFQNGGIGYIRRDEVLSGQELIDSWKIFISAAYGAGNDYPHSILGQPFIGEPGTVCTETYVAIGPFSSEDEARSALSYITTKFFRFLVMLHKPAQHAARSVYSLVPDQDFSRTFSDEYLYSFYGLSESEIRFIDGIVRPMELV